MRNDDGEREEIGATSSARGVMDSIRRIVSALRLFDRAAEKHGKLSAAQLFVLQQLGETNAASVNELAVRTHTHQSSVSVVVRKLVEKRLVRRKAADQDGRRVELSLTDGGRRVLHRSPVSAQERLIAALLRLPAVKHRQLAAGLAELVREMGIDEEKPALFFEDGGEKLAAVRQITRAGAKRVSHG